MCLVDFYMGSHSKQKANEKSSQSDSTKGAANIHIFQQSVMDVMLSCGSSLCPVG